jgi:hypothetical protein
LTVSGAGGERGMDGLNSHRLDVGLALSIDFIEDLLGRLER